MEEADLEVFKKKSKLLEFIMVKFINFSGNELRMNFLYNKKQRD